MKAIIIILIVLAAIAIASIHECSIGAVKTIAVKVGNCYQDVIYTCNANVWQEAERLIGIACP
jgi:hypothetical protein